MDILYLYLIIYVAVLLFVSWIVSRNQKKEDYLIAGRNRGTGQILFSKFAQYIGAGYFITYTGFAYEYGFGVFAMLLGMFVGYLLFGFWAAPRIHAPSKENRFYKIGNMVFHRTKNKLASKTADWLSNLILFLWLLVGVIGGAKIISDFGLMSYEAAVILTIVVTLTYLLLAGFKAVLITDVIQAFIILALLFVVTFGIIGGTGLGTLFSVQTGGVNILTAISFFFFGMLAIFSYSNMYQLCYSAKSSKNIKQGISFSVVPILLVGFFLLLIGLFMAANAPGLDSGLVFTGALKNFLPASLLPLAVILFFAGIMSSADTNIYAISSHYSIGKSRNPVKGVRISTFVLIALVLIVSLIFRDVVDVSILAGGFSLTMSFAMIYIIAGGKSPKRFMASVILGLVSLVIGAVFFGIEPMLAVPVIILSALGLLWKR